MQDLTIRDKEFLGQGMAYPLHVNPRGELALAKGEEDIHQAILIILQTRPGERVRRPEFGCGVQDVIFEPRTAATKELLAYNVRKALVQWEPRIELQRVNVQDDPGIDGGVLVEIKYTIKSSYDERSIIYPFYLMGEEVNNPH